ncbi:UPF0489 protein C5orf22 homolog [Culicoides brevitarsis]|uniref:UPF0489 protein C5orf22 homolog n=1 Tax=Culicoides brevitarsis TaxID=469753 RepID=UPI00307B6D9B
MAQSAATLEKKLQSELDALKNTQKDTPTLRTFPKTPIYIYEDHNEVLEPIYNCLKSRHLPFTGNFLIHFDSHPDLCRPEHMPACFVFDKTLLLEAVNIENWILPPIYGGHIDHVVWVKPPWAQQIPSGSYNFEIGEYDKEIYVHAMLDYYISEGSYCRSEDLKNKKTWKLESVDGKDTLNEGTLEKTAFPYILDIDLDYFSTVNPFLDIYSKANTYERLKQIYISPKTFKIGDEESVIEFTKSRRAHLKYLESVFKALEVDPDVEKLENHPTNPQITELLKSLLVDLQRHYDKNELDYEIIHNAGCTCDTIELPHHISSKTEITEMVSEFKRFLKTLKAAPTIVTISRSSEYSHDVVDFIQESVVDALKNVFKEQICDQPELLYLEDE